MKKALLFGASGLVGSYLLQELLNSNTYSEVLVVVRRPLAAEHPKLVVITADFDGLPAVQDKLVADDVFIALGTTKKKTPDKQAYYKIDHDYPVLAATLAKAKGAGAVYVVSAIGADAASRIFYTRTKGEMERDILALNYKHTYIFRPSLIMGERQESRPVEKLFMRLWPVVDALLVTPGLKKYKGIDAALIAKAMVAAAQWPAQKVSVCTWQKMKALATPGALGSWP